MDELELVFDLTQPNYPRVQIAVNGSTELDGGDHPLGHHPEQLLDTAALVPRDVPHRVALAGCCCGEFGCSTLTALIVADDDVVRWTDLAEGDGHFDQALPYGDLPDPLALGRRTPLDRRRELAFDADQYLRVLGEAATDRSWETRAVAVARLTRQALGWRGDPDSTTLAGDSNGTVLAWKDETQAVAVNVAESGRWSTYLVPIPDGSAEDAAHQLAGLLRRRHPRELDGARQLGV